ncbi:hypothetical protein [Sphingomonas sp.]|uniref:hypothetical protein n=1 Tax=Sphingomonas sp. TaxID=28214 RepID=UPI0035A87D15
MATATVRAPKPGNAKGRPGTGRPSAIFINNDKSASTEFEVSAQVLAAKYGITQHHARTVLFMLRGGRDEG